MAERVQKLVTEASFDANGVYIPEGHIGSFDPARLNGDEEHLLDVNEGHSPVVVEMAPIGPTGPNPTQPQQIPPEAVQGPGGQYVAPGRTLVGEVTRPQEERLAGLSAADDTTEADIDALINGNGQNNDDALVAGTVAEVTADLGSKTDEQLEALRAAEVDREQPRKGVLDAVKAEQARRA